MTWLDALTSCFHGDDDPKGPPKGSKVEPVAIARKDVAKPRSMTRIPSFLTIPGSPKFAEDLSTSLGSNICIFTTGELRSITNNYSSSFFLGEGGFGPVYKGIIDEKLKPGVLKPMTVAVKLLDLEGSQGHKEWLAEVIYLGQLEHDHVVKLIGYCCEDEQRLLVYEFMARGSLENHLFKRFSISLPWEARLKIAVGAAKGLAFLHGLEKPIIFRDFKASNILLHHDFTAKLSDFGLAKDGPEGEDTHVSTRVMGTHGYAAPEYVMTGHLTAKSDVYSYGVVLLELLTGLRAMDKKRPGRQQNLVEWARPYLHDERRVAKIMDLNLNGQYSMKAAQKAAALAYECLSPNPKNRPRMNAVVETLEPLQALDDVARAHFVYTADSATGKSSEKDRKSAGKENGHGRSTRSEHHSSHRIRSPISTTESTKSKTLRADGISYKRSAANPKHRGNIEENMKRRGGEH